MVAVPNHTFIATWLAVGAVGAIPIGINCDESGLMDLDQLERETSKISAVIPVHMHGQMVDMRRLMAWANSRGINVIEDCAQAHGAEIEGKKAGSWGDFGAFSFYPTKNLGACGDAGALATNNQKLANEARSFVNYGSIYGKKYQYSRLGINSRLDPMQAKVLSLNLSCLDTWNHHRRQIADTYASHFSKLGITNFKINENSVFHHFIVFSKNREISRKLLIDNGIKTAMHYPELACETYSKLTGINSKPASSNTRKFASNGISLPISQWHDISDINYIIEVISRSTILRSFLMETK